MPRGCARDQPVRLGALDVEAAPRPPDWVRPAAKYSHAARVASEASPSIIGTLSEEVTTPQKPACKILQMLQKIADADRDVNSQTCCSAAVLANGAAGIVLAKRSW